MSLRALGRAVSVLLSLPLMAQTTAELAAAFDREAEAYEATTGSDRLLQARRLSNAFLQLPDGAARWSRLPLGAQATLEAGRVEHALRLAQQPPTAPVQSGLLTVRLRALIRLGNLPLAAETLRKHEPQWTDAISEALRCEERGLLPLAAAALRTSDRADGRLMFEQLARLEPFMPYRIANLALCLRQIGELDEAEKAYEVGRNLAPADLELWNDYGLFLRATGRRSDAIRAFRKSVALDLARAPSERAKGPAITNLLHMEALWPQMQGDDPIPTAVQSLAQRPEAVMLRRLMLDVVVGRAVRR